MEQVACVKLLVEAGFLAGRFADLGDGSLAARLESSARHLLGLPPGTGAADEERKLWSLTADAWREYEKARHLGQLA